MSLGDNLCPHCTAGDHLKCHGPCDCRICKVAGPPVIDEVH